MKTDRMHSLIYSKKMLQLYFKALKEKNAEKALFYYQNIDGAACISFEQFVGSWAYSEWTKKNQKAIDNLKHSPFPFPQDRK